MTEKRYSHDGVVIVDHLKEDLIYIDGKDELLELAEYVDRLQEENEELKFENENLKVAIQARDVKIEVCEKKFRELGYIITVDDDGYVIE